MFSLKLFNVPDSRKWRDGHFLMNWNEVVVFLSSVSLYSLVFPSRPSDCPQCPPFYRRRKALTGKSQWECQRHLWKRPLLGLILSRKTLKTETVALVNREMGRIAASKDTGCLSASLSSSSVPLGGPLGLVWEQHGAQSLIEFCFRKQRGPSVSEKTKIPSLLKSAQTKHQNKAWARNSP